jgi:hypothetical protein
MSRSHAVLKFMRQVHLYIGVFTTPALLFFAITGALQTFSLHEQTRGSSYKPPALLAELGQLHKKQTTVMPVRRPQSSGPDKGPDKAPDPSLKEAQPSGKGGAAENGSEGGHPHGGDGKKGGQVDKHALTPQSSGLPAASPEQAQSGLAKPSKGPEPSATPQKSHLPMKIFFLLVSISLVTSTLTGLYLSYKYSRGWILITSLLVAGLVIPILLLPF